MKKFELLINSTATGIYILLADTFFEKLIGFMFAKKADYGILFLKCRSIHTFFMKFNIDAVFLDSKNRVVKTIKNINPRKIILPVKYAANILELPSGILDTSSIRHGDLLTFD
ncbi:MAG: DUF192 domain-containing protein [Elusimicrobia bacterium]|nr:DUF192 domain-containing protein [Elusimicrobiota bacterium]